MSEAATACRVCGTVVPPRPVTWSLELTAHGTEWLCECCTRNNVRSIEARLDDAWW